MTYSKETDLLCATPLLATHDLAVKIEGHIERRASGRIRDLHVVCEEGHITLTGRSRTYHAKQLALQAALDLSGEHCILANLIEVF